MKRRAGKFSARRLLSIGSLRRQPMSAEEGTRTPTGLRPLAPEASASTSSTTSAKRFLNLMSLRGESQPHSFSTGATVLCCRQSMAPEKTEKRETESIARNRRARHDYQILDTWEAGIVLTGSEVKSLRSGKANISDAYGIVKDGEVHLLNLHISPYEQASYFNHEPTRTRKLLLHRREIRKLIGAVERQGLTLVPIELYFKRGKAKVLLGLGRGKKLYDKRADEKRRDDERDIQRAVRT